MHSLSEHSADAIHEGHDGWLFLMRDNVDLIDFYRQQSAFTAGMAQQWSDLLESRSVSLARNDIGYLHLPVPDKLTLMHGFYQGTLENPDGSPIQQLAARHGRELPCLINPVPYFARQIDKFPLYWKSDTHWTAWGCFMAYQLLCGRLDVPINNHLLSYPYDESEMLLNLGSQLEPAQKEQIRRYRLDRRSRRRYANALVEYLEKKGLDDTAGAVPGLHLPAAHVPGAHVVFENAHPDAHQQCVVIFGDSSANFRRNLLTGMLAETFAEVHFIWSESIDYAYVERVKPNLVLTQTAERSMAVIPRDSNDAGASESAHFNRLAQHTLTRLQKRYGGETETPVAGSVTKSVWLPQETYALSPPIMVQTGCISVEQDNTMVTNPVTCIEASDVRVYFTGDSWHVADAKRKMLFEWNMEGRNPRTRAWQGVKHLAGTTLTFGASAGTHCYYHWMLELLPKLGLLERQGIELSSINHFLVREITGAWQLETLNRFGIDSSRIVETVKQPHMRCDKLLHIDLACGINLRMHRFIPLWMKDLFPVDTSSLERIKLYISRPEGVRRGISNEKQIIPLLEDAGFTIMAMEGLTVAEQAALLARADVLMSPHGGALTNMVFCRPGIKVVELLSRHVFPYYYGLAANCGHTYYAILENPPEDYSRLVSRRVAQSWSHTQKETAGLEFEVCVDSVKRVLEYL